MRYMTISLMMIVLFSANTYAQQAPSCPTNSILAHNGNIINNHALPNGPAGLQLNNMPAGSGGLAVGPSFGFPAPNPTWWTVSGGTYWYFNNTGGWTNTGHGTGNGAAVNLGGGGNAIYNMVGANGGIYKYNGTGPGFFLTNLVPAFGGGGPYDMVADMADNFYVLKSQAPNQGLYIYNPMGVLQCSFAAVGMISQSAGGGFAILNTANPSVHRVYYNSNGTDYIGDVIPGNPNINFTVQALPGGSDYASCALTIPQGSVTAGGGGGTLTCTNPQVTLIASIFGNNSFNWMPAYPTNTAAAQNPTCGGINWTGPGPNTTVGIVSGQGTPTIVVNQPGVYSFTWTGCNGCPGYSVTASFTVVGQGATILPIITAPTCISSPTQISVSPNSATNTILWNGPGIQGPNNTPTITINSAGIYSVSISIPNSACAGTATVLISPTPTISIAASSNSMCANNTNSSPNSVTLTASGATSYTWNSVGLINTSSSNTNTAITYTPDANVTNGYVTLIGSNGTCTNSATYTINIIPNPVISAISTSVCAGNNATLVASNASSYTWSPAATLNTSIGATVIATTNTTTVYSVIGSSLGCNSATQNATVVVMPNPTITISPLTNTICQGGNITLTASGATNYTWSPSSTLNTNTGSVVIASPMNTTSYLVIASLGTCTASAAYQVSVIPQPNVQVTAPQYTICENSAGVLLSANGANSYVWTPGNGLNKTTGNQVLAKPMVTTVYEVVGNNGQCTAAASLTLFVVPFPDLTLSTPNNKICQTATTTIFANGANNYVWSPLTGLSNMQGNMANASPMSSINYTVMGVNSMGTVSCSSTKEILIEVVPQVTATVSNSVEICKGQSTKVMVYGGNTYAWLPIEGISASDVNNPFVSPKATTVYSVHVSNGGNCGTTATVLVKVNPIPTISAGEDIIANIDEPMYIHAISNGSLTWVSGEGVVCAACPSTQIIPKKSGCYIAEAVNSYGCKSRDEVCVEVTTNYNIYIPNVFTPNGDGNNDVFLVHGTGLSKFELSIFDRWGEKLFTSSDQLQGWDGTYKGELCKQDAYTYVVVYTALDGKKHEKTGHVSLLK